MRERLLICEVYPSETEGMVMAEAKLIDGTVFQVKVGINEIVEMPGQKLLKILEVGIQGKYVNIVLPSPSLKHGKRVCVSWFDLE